MFSQILAYSSRLNNIAIVFRCLNTSVVSNAEEWFISNALAQ